MYLDLRVTLDQGTRVFAVEEGYKDCKAPGRYLVRRFGDKLVCPGCKYMCALQAMHNPQVGEAIIVTKRQSLIKTMRTR
ncbi:hypothetical protein DSECCO2_591720 [anaerobic digester metagenome]